VSIPSVLACGESRFTFFSSVKQVPASSSCTTSLVPRLSDFERGIVVGLLIGEGSFGGDGKQPQITLRMHVRHEAMFRWLMERFPDTRLYGPYHHAGRAYYQWMARGTALVRDVLPLLDGAVDEGLDGHAAQRLATMLSRYSAFIERERARLPAAGNGR
jgi:hypothetical protein